MHKKECQDEGARHSFFDAQKNQRFPFPISVIFCKSKQKMTKIHFLPFQILTNSHLSCKMWY